jgi:uncharacterized protein YajQ (UPF0234 family)
MDLAKKIIKTIKEAKIKVQASIQGDELRVNGAKARYLARMYYFSKVKPQGLSIAFW